MKERNKMKRKLGFATLGIFISFIIALFSLLGAIIFEALNIGAYINDVSTKNPNAYLFPKLVFFIIAYSIGSVIWFLLLFIPTGNDSKWVKILMILTYPVFCYLAWQSFNELFWNRH